jgi:hypothetical protein
LDLAHDLARLTNQPTKVTIGGRKYGFSEIPLAGLGELQQWLKEHVPRPLDAIKGRLEGFNERERAELLRQAREEDKAWPPQMGSAAAAGVLLSSEAGQIQALWVALRVHQPETTLEQAHTVYRKLQREAAAVARKRRGDGSDAEATATKVFSIAFGMDDEAEDDDPKDA